MHPMRNTVAASQWMFRKRPVPVSLVSSHVELIDSDSHRVGLSGVLRLLLFIFFLSQRRLFRLPSTSTICWHPALLGCWVRLGAFLPVWCVTACLALAHWLVRVLGPPLRIYHDAVPVST